MIAVAHTIITRARARADVRGYLLWLTANRSAAVASRWLGRYDAAIATVADDPRRFPEAEEAADLGFDLREATLRQGRTHYRILFTISGDTVNILRVRHAAQDRLTDADV